MAATYVKFYDFVEALGNGEHNLGSDQLECYLTNAAPDVAADADKTDLAEITVENGYTGPKDIQNTFSETTGTGTVVAVDLSWTATSGGFGPFRYAVVFNQTHTSDGLICYWDYGSSISCNEGESFTVNFGANLFTIA